MSVNYESIVSVIRDTHIVSDTSKLLEPGVMDIKVVSYPRSSTHSLYKFDPENVDLFPCFSTEPNTGLRDIFDYVLLVDYNERLYILLFELKNSNNHNNKAKKQLDTTDCLLKYIIQSAKRIGKQIDNTHILIRKILVKELRVRLTTKMHDIEYDQYGYVDYPFTDIHIRGLLK